MAKIKEAFMHDVLRQYTKEEISFSRMVEILNEKAISQLRPEAQVIAYEFRNPKTGHCYVDYIRRSDIEETNSDYDQTPLYYHAQQSTLPTDKEIDKASNDDQNKTAYYSYQHAFRNGAKWMRDK